RGFLEPIAPRQGETNMTKDEATHLAREIAGHLGDGWTAVEDLDGYGVLGLLRNGDAEIGIRSDTWAPKGMLHLHGFRPRHLHEFWPYQSVPDSINVSPARPPVQIAREIRRRLLPRYEANLEAARQTKARAEAAFAAMRALADELLALAPNRFDAANQARHREYQDRNGVRNLDRSETLWLNHPEDHTSGTIEVQPGGHIRLNSFTLSAGLARRFVRLLAEPAPGEE
ncbi:MAG TPA: hypothetical protein PLZ94_17950, partial [Armatimonadota bacterium]|nr:hypothetical protein [Armatimonadota bacterium]